MLIFILGVQNEFIKIIPNQIRYLNVCLIKEKHAKYLKCVESISFVGKYVPIDTGTETRGGIRFDTRKGAPEVT